MPLLRCITSAHAHAVYMNLDLFQIISLFQLVWKVILISARFTFINVDQGGMHCFQMKFSSYFSIKILCCIYFEHIYKVLCNVPTLGFNLCGIF